jgi:hypothetical protein
MKAHPKINLVLSTLGVEQIEVLYSPGQRDQAWLLCRQLLPALERLEQTLAGDPGEPL